MPEPSDRPSTVRLVAALEAAGAPENMIERAKTGYYHPKDSTLSFPELQLLADAQEAGLRALIPRIIDDDFTPDESEILSYARNDDTT